MRKKWDDELDEFDELNALNALNDEFDEFDEFDELPDCPCGWSGKGSGPGGRFIKGDRCPVCGEFLY